MKGILLNVTFFQEELEKQVKDLLGEKTAADDEKIIKKKKEKKPRAEVPFFLDFFVVKARIGIFVPWFGVIVVITFRCVPF